MPMFEIFAEGKGVNDIAPIITSADSPYQASLNELVLVADGGSPPDPVVIYAPPTSGLDSGAVFAVKNVGDNTQDITILGYDNDAPLGTDYFFTCDQPTVGGPYALNEMPILAGGEAKLFRFIANWTTTTGDGGYWAVIAGFTN